MEAGTLSTMAGESATLCTHGDVAGDMLDVLAPDATALGATLGEPRWEDDHWGAKVEALLDDPLQRRENDHR